MKTREAALEGFGDETLPVLRPDLKIYPGPRLRDGSPSFTVYDPLSRTFSKIGWAAALVLERLRAPRTIAELMADLTRTTTLRMTEEDVLAVCRTAEFKRLTTSTLTRPVEDLLAERRSRKIKPFKWLLHHYLYFRIPLLRPDAFLSRALPYARLFGAKSARCLYGLIFVAGLAMVLERSDEYFGTFPYFFNWVGVATFGMAVAAIKIAHEFAHAFTAKQYGVRVPVMGVAFIVLWPVAFCDVTDAWKISDRRQRLSISFAGVAAELVIAGLALFGWGMTKPGILHSVCFVVSSSSLLSTLLVNFNPAMRFDGYYILMDMWGIDNLQTRAFAMTRWGYRKWLLGIDMLPPERVISAQRLYGMIAYSLYAWNYRFFLYLGIAALVYYKFTKTVGIFLFGVEVWWFILSPLAREVKDIMKIRRLVSMNKRFVLSILLAAAAFLWFVLPLPRRFSVPAVVVPSISQVIYAPHAGSIQGLEVKQGSRVDARASLLSIASRSLRDKYAILELEKGILERKQRLYELSAEKVALLPEQRQQIVSITAQMSGLRKQIELSNLLSEQSGTIYDWDETIKEGRFVSSSEKFGKIADFSRVFVKGFVNESKVSDILIGQDVIFLLKGNPEPINAKVSRLNPVRADTIRYNSLVSLSNSSFAVSEDKFGRHVVHESCYLIEVEFDDHDVPTLRTGQSGKIWMVSPPRSLLVETAREAYRVLIRESNF